MEKGGKRRNVFPQDEAAERNSRLDDRQGTRLFKKGAWQESRLGYLGNALMENRNRSRWRPRLRWRPERPTAKPPRHLPINGAMSKTARRTRQRFRPICS
jgi:hypothetical protein